MPSRPPCWLSATEHLLPIFLLSKRDRVYLGRHRALGGLRLGLHRHLPLLTGEVLCHHPFVDIDRIRAVKSCRTACGQPELVLARPRLILGPPRKQYPLPRELSEPSERQIAQLRRLIRFVRGPVTTSLLAGVLHRVVREDRRGSFRQAGFGDRAEHGAHIEYIRRAGLGVALEQAGVGRV